MFLAISQDLGLPLSLGYLLATVPLINVASALPISVNGIGIREVLTVFLFTPVGVSQEQAVVFGALWIVTVTLVSAVGGLLTASEAVAGQESAADGVVKIDSKFKEQKRA